MDSDKWVVAIIAQFDEKVTVSYEELEASIEAQASDENVSYIIFFYDQASKKAEIRRAVKESKHFRIKAIESLGEIDLYDGIRLEWFFENYVAQGNEYDRSRYLLLTWGHGAGLGFFYRKDDLPDDIKKLQFVRGNLSVAGSHIDFGIANPFQGDSFHSLLKPEERQTIISLIPAEQLSRIIQKGMGRKKITVLICMNCYMQCFETGYALKDAVDYMVAPQTTIAFRGYNYFELFKLLHHRPQCSIHDIAGNLCGNFASRYQSLTYDAIETNDNEDREPWISEMGFSVNDLNRYEEWKDFINFFSVFLFDRSHTGLNLEQAIERARKNCHYLTWRLNMGVIDFKHFVDELAKQLSPDDFKTYLADKFEYLLELQHKTVIQQQAAPQLFWVSESGSRYQVSRSPQVFSIFFPSNSGTDDYVKYFIKKFYAVDATYQPSLNKAFLWDEFILHYCETHKIYP